MIVDAHCDTIIRTKHLNEKFKHNLGNLDFERMKLAGNYLQFMAVFMDAKKFPILFEETMKYIEFYYNEMAENSEIAAHCNTFAEIENACKNEKVCTLLTLEGGEVLDGKIENLHKFYKKGVRSIGLTWNLKNNIADGVEVLGGKGLTKFGFEVVKEMENIGMIVDVSHLNELGFWDIYETANKPFIASHSNCYSICENIRNLTDKQIKAVANKKGVIGINLYTGFLHKNNEAGIEDVIKHINHIVDLVGVDYVGFGSDFDGVTSIAKGLESPDKYLELKNHLSVLYSEDDVNKIMGGNFLRVLKEVLKN